MRESACDIISYQHAIEDVSRDCRSRPEARGVYAAGVDAVFAAGEIFAWVVICSAAYPAAPADRGALNGLIF